ncbi:hypothetical protein AB0G74_29825 [Streptomyces sp. NPDC020875]|uniref:hypothetical protein n=1 Tax=Streptomyces sp. NPDC020875 TaxID=3154898 RepID=UPI0033C149B8
MAPDSRNGGVLRQAQRCCRPIGSTRPGRGEDGGDGDTMTELKPMDDETAPEVAALAGALRDLFADLGVSIRRYAARRSYDSATVSRYLGGRRVPPWEFVLHLLHDVAERRGAVPTQDALELFKGLYNSALESGRSPVHRARLLERKLADADREAQRAATRERWLEDTLHDREQRLRDLQIRFRELQAASFAPSDAPDPAASSDLSDESTRLRAEIHELEEELTRVRALHQRAEERCEQLERQLAEAEGEDEDADRGEGEARGRLPEAVRGSGPGGEGSDGEGPDGEGSGRAARTGTTWSAVSGDVQQVVYNGYVSSDGWQVDEEFVFARSVRISDGERHLGNGLLVDPTTVVTVSYVLQQLRNASDAPTVRSATGERVSATPVEITAETTQESLYEGSAPLAVLRLDSPVPLPDTPLRIDGRFTPGRQLLVSAYAANGRFSCLLDLTGRTGDRLRVAGDIVNGLGGAPAFTSTGALAGIVVARWQEGRGGFLLPVTALGALKSVTVGE